MSLLDEITKTKLKCCKTVVTRADGRKYLECKNNSVLLGETSCGFVIDTKPDDKPALIIEHLYLGSQDCCTQKVLIDYNINYVLSVGIDALEKFDNATYKFIHCLDLPETNIIALFLTDAFEFIRHAISENCNVLIHCNAGVSRSPSIVIAYLMYEKKLSYTDAFTLVKNQRACIRPNDGFTAQLKKFNAKNTSV